MPITFTYESILDGVTDSCSLTQPVVSNLPQVFAPTRNSLGRAGASNVPPATEATGSGSLPGQTPGVQQIQDLTVSENAISGNITIDLIPYQTALQGLNFPQNNDVVLSAELSANKIKPSLDSLLGINAFGSSSYLGSVNGSVLINSDRVIVNAKERLAMLCGKKGVAIAAPTRVNIDAGESITLAAYGSEKSDGSLFIGLPGTGLSYQKKNQKQIGTTKGHPTVDMDYEPLVLGIKLANLLEDFLYILKSAEGVDAFSPVKFQPTVQAELALLANRIPEMLSNYAYIDGMSHRSVDMEQLKAIAEAQAQTPDYIPPPNLTGSFEGQFTITTQTGGEFGGGGADASGPGWEPLIKLIRSGESPDGYDSLNPSTTFTKEHGKSAVTLTIQQAYDFAKITAAKYKPKYGKISTGAIGLYQFLPVYFLGWVKSAGLSPSNLCDQNAQDRIAIESLVKPGTLGKYITGKLVGTQPELEKAVQAYSQIWASAPTIKNDAQKIVGNVTQQGSSGKGQTNQSGYYVSSGQVNSHYPISDVVKVFMKVRKNLGGSKPTFIPSYITWDSL